MRIDFCPYFVALKYDWSLLWLCFTSNLIFFNPETTVTYLSLLGSSWAGLRRKVAFGLVGCSLWGLSVALCLAGGAAVFLAERLILSSSMLMSFSDSWTRKERRSEAFWLCKDINQNLLSTSMTAILHFQSVCRPGLHKRCIQRPQCSGLHFGQMCLCHLCELQSPLETLLVWVGIHSSHSLLSGILTLPDILWTKEKKRIIATPSVILHKKSL